MADIITLEGIEIEVENPQEEDRNAERRMTSYLIKGVREYSGMSRPKFADWLGIPYRTLQEWELGRRQMPDYVLRLIAYKVATEKKKKR